MYTEIYNIIEAGLASDPAQVEAFARLLAENLDKAGEHKASTRVRRALGDHTTQSLPVSLG